MSLTQIDVDPAGGPTATDPGSPANDPAADGATAATIDLTAHGERVASSRPQFTITEAASACAVSRKTITRKLTDLAEHGAAKDDDGVWRIPVEALLAVGLHPGRSLPPRSRPGASVTRQVGPNVAVAGADDQATTARQAPTAGSGDLVTVPRDRWDDLRIRLARAEAEAAERALALADARLALRALTAGPPGEPTATHRATPVPSATGTGAAGPSLRHDLGPGGEGADLEPSPRTPTGAATASVAGARHPGVTVPVGGPVAPGLPVGHPGSPATVEPPSAVDPVVLARTQAAQSGGYVPAAPGAPRKRHWWQAKERS
jgi:hypothetical protein